MSEKFKPRLEILPAAQRRLWGELIDIPSEFILYGGTAIALHLGHRQSVDFDFFGAKQFDPDDVLQSVPFLADATIIQKSPNTLTVVVDRGDPVQVSFFGVPALKRLRNANFADENGLRVASMLDLAGTKAAVVQKRAEAKDYIDLDAMISEGTIDLPQALPAGLAIYGKQFKPELTLKALCYFDEGNVSTLSTGTRLRLVTAVKAVDLAKLPSLEHSEDDPSRGNEP